MGNCLSTRRGITKYATRARQRSSSFWIVAWRRPETPKQGVGKVAADVWGMMTRSQAENSQKQERVRARVASLQSAPL